MFLLICMLEKGISKEKIDSIIACEKNVQIITWLNGENGKVKEVNDNPMIVGTLRSIFKCKEQDVLLAKIEGRKNVDLIIKYISDISRINRNLEYFVIPLAV